MTCLIFLSDSDHLYVSSDKLFCIHDGNGICQQDMAMGYVSKTDSELHLLIDSRDEPNPTTNSSNQHKTNTYILNRESPTSSALPGLIL